MAVGGACTAETVANVTPVGVATLVCSSALRANAARNRSLIFSISSCNCCSSPGLGVSTAAGGGATTGEPVAPNWPEEAGMGGAQGRERSRLAREGAGGANGPPFSQRPPLSQSGLARPTFGSSLARRASRRRVLMVSRLNWIRLKSRPSFTEAAVAAAPASFSHWLFNAVDEVGGAFCRLLLD